MNFIFFYMKHLILEMHLSLKFENEISMGNNDQAHSPFKRKVTVAPGKGY